MADATWTDRAEEELPDVTVYITIHGNGRAAAQRVYAAVKAAAKLRSTQPLAGESRPDLGEELHVFVHQRWVVVYRPSDVGITVVGIVDGSRDFGELFLGR